MEYKSKSVINNIEEIKGDISFILRMLKNNKYDVKFKEAIEDWIRFNYGDDVAVHFPEFGQINIRKQYEMSIFVVY